VELTPVGVGAADRGQEDGFLLRPVAGQVFGPEHDRLAGTATHEDGGQPNLAHAFLRALLPSGVLPAMFVRLGSRGKGGGQLVSVADDMSGFRRDRKSVV